MTRLLRHVLVQRRGAPRWPWVVGSALAVATVWRCEATRPTGAVTRDDRTAAPAHERPGQTALRARRRARATALTRKLLTPRPRGSVRVTGRVYDAATGDSVPGAEVIFGEGVRPALSDDQGIYLVDLPPGRYHPYVRGDSVVSVGRAPRGLISGRPERGAVAAPAARLTPELSLLTDLNGVDFDVTRSATVRGRVVDPDGHPIPGAMVQARPEDDRDLLPVLGTNVAESDAEGRFTLTLAAKPHQLTPFHDRYTAHARPIIGLDPGETVEPELTMTAGCVITGQVVRDSGPAGPGVLQRGGSPDNLSAFVGAGAKFDATGRVLWSTDEESTIWLQAALWDGGSSPPIPFQCQEGARFTGATFEIPPGAPVLSGTVVTADGTPSGDAFIDITAVLPGRDAERARADHGGAWTAHDLAPGEYDVVARVPGQGLATARVKTPGRDVTLRLSGTGALEGKTRGMVDGVFTLEADCTGVRLYGGDTADRFVVSVRGGTYRVEGVPACAARIIGRSALWHTAAHDVAVSPGGTATLDLDLSALVSKQALGFVHDASGQPIAHALVRVADQPGLQTQSDEDGRFTIRGAPGARLVVTGGAGVSATIELPDNDEATCDVDVSLDPRGAPSR